MAKDGHGDKRGRRDKKRDAIPTAIFSPNTAIASDNAFLFTGRRDLLSDALKALERPGGSLVVFGEPGAGKTSFAKVLMLLLGGEEKKRKKLVKDLGGFSGRAKRTEKTGFGCVWREVDVGITSLEDLLYRMMNPIDLAPYSLAVQFPKVAEAIREEYVKINEERVHEMPSGNPRQLNPAHKRVHSLFERAENLINEHYSEVAPLFFIDELDQLKSKRGLGQFIKNRSSSFVLIGIANTVEELVADHRSAERKIAREYKIPRLNKQEVIDLFRRAES